MKNFIKWVHITLDFKNLKAEELIPVSTAVKNQLTIDTDVPVAGSPITMAVYNQQITDLSSVLVAHKTNKSASLTDDAHIKASTLCNSTLAIAHYVETTANTKFPGDVNTINKIITRFGFKVKQLGVHVGHGFEVAESTKSSITIHVPVTSAGAHYLYQSSPTPADPKSWAFPIYGKTKITINNLQSGINYGFRYAILTIPKGKHIVIAGSEEPLWSDTIMAVIQ